MSKGSGAGGTHGNGEGSAQSQKPLDLLADMIWAYRNINQSRPRGKSPNGTWGMWDWARENRKEFMRELLARLLPIPRANARAVPREEPEGDSAEALAFLEKQMEGEGDEGADAERG